MKVKSSKLKVKSYPPSNPPLTKGGRWGGKKGFTLIEIVMIIVVVAITIPALLIILGQQTKQSVNAELQISATNLGQAMMEEIRSKCWDEFKTSLPNCTGTGAPGALGINGGETAGNPATYDDVDDYNAGVPPLSVGGVSYTRTVQVCYVPSGNLNDTSACNTATDYKRIRVTVNNPNLGSVELVTVVTNY